MEIHRMKPENPIIIVDEAEIDRIDSIAKLKEEEVERLADEKFLRHVKNSGVHIMFLSVLVLRVIDFEIRLSTFPDFLL